MMQLHLIYAANIPLLRIGSTFRGSTIGASHLVNVDRYTTGQALYEVPISRHLLERLRTHNSELSVTTCSSFKSFDTVLYVFSSNPLKNNVSKLQWIDKNDNDCGLQSTIQIRVSTGTSLYFLLTGYRGSEGDYQVEAQEISNGAIPTPWGLDRVDQRALPLDGRFSIEEGGQGVFIYVLDSGVRATHSEFLREDGTSRVIFGNDFVERLSIVVDESGHGTHVAALAAGKTFGVAKQATVVSVRVLDRINEGLISQLVEALVWTRQHIQRKNNIPAIVVMSLSTSVSEVLNDAVAEMTSAGIAVITAAGNDGKDGCLASPASEKSALTVGATNRKDQASIISNRGECVNIYAPGENVLSAWHTGDSATKQLSGTSCSCPLAGGVAALLVEQNPLLNPQEIKEVISGTGTIVVKESEHATEEATKREGSVGKKRLGRMLYVRSIPVVLRDGQPPQGKMFLYVIFGLGSDTEGHQQCLLRQNHSDSFRIILSSVFGKSPQISIDWTPCCQGQRQNGCEERGLVPRNHIIVRVLAPESHAYSTFESLSAFCRNKKGAVSQLRAALDMNVSVAAEPWVLDSRGYKYWAAPAFAHTMNRDDSTTRVVVIVCLITLLVLSLVVTTLCLIEHSKRRQRQKEQEYYEARAREYEAEKKKHTNLRGHEELKLNPFSPQEMRRVNSELQGDILKFLSPSGVIPTPTTQGPYAARSPEASLAPIETKIDMLRNSGTEPEVQVGGDRSRNIRGLPQKTQASTSFFTRLWTPRAHRETAAPSSTRGNNPFRALPSILSFGPERGAVVQPTLPSPVATGIASEMTEGDAEKDETDPNASQKYAHSETL